MHLIKLMVIYLYRKYRVHIHNFNRKWNRGANTFCLYHKGPRLNSCSQGSFLAVTNGMAVF